MNSDRDLVGSIAYVGTKGTHLTAERDLNQLQPLVSAPQPLPRGSPLPPVSARPAPQLDLPG